MTGRLTGLAAAALGGAAVLLLGPPPAQATSGPCVAVIVDTGSALSGRCTSWTPGVTGLGALSATGHTYRFAPSGLLCSIDGFPAGCSVDNTHYWSYWHRAAGATSWSYSNEGGGTYHPAASSTDGWAYQNGSPRQPRSIAFATICPAPAPSPTTRPSPPPPPPPTQPPAARVSPTHITATHTTGPAGTQRAAGQPPAVRPGAARPVAGAGGPVRSTASSPSISPSPPRAVAIAGTTRVGSRSPAGARSGSPSADATPVDLASPPPGGPTRPLLLAGLGILAAATLGAAAWRRSRLRS